VVEAVSIVTQRKELLSSDPTHASDKIQTNLCKLTKSEIRDIIRELKLVKQQNTSSSVTRSAAYAVTQERTSLASAAFREQEALVEQV